MLFPTITFAFFLAIVLPLNWALMRKPVQWKLFLLAASYVFYGWADWRFCFLLAANTALNLTFGALLGRVPLGRDGRRERGRLWLICGVSANLVVLGIFKYLGFFVTSVTTLLSPFGIPPAVLHIALPVGVSFFTFQGISYLVDLFRGEIAPARPLDFAVYQSYFPHLVAGPIVRSSEFIPQLQTPRDDRKIDVSRAAWLIMGGLFKKLVISSALAEAIVNPVFDRPSGRGALETIVAIYAYAVQIYADFSGYTDMAIGLALLLGIRFPDNFNAPYTATSLQDFWRRWHMTLSRWLRDYLYVPLGGSRGTESRTDLNLMATMLLGGLWHGASWTFVIWGGIHGVGQVIGRRRREQRDAAGTPASPRRPWQQVAATAATFHIVCFAWIFFRARGVGDAFAVLANVVVGWGRSNELVTATVLGLILLGLVPQFVLTRTLVGRAQALLSRLSPVPLAAALACGLMLIDAFHDALVTSPVDPFIYFKF